MLKKTENKSFKMKQNLLFYAKIQLRKYSYISAAFEALANANLAVILQAASAAIKQFHYKQFAYLVKYKVHFISLHMFYKKISYLIIYCIFL